MPAVQLISHGDWRAFEWWHPPVDGVNYFDWLHPPFAKYIQAISVFVGREWFNSVSPMWWRLPSALAGVATVWLAYGFVVEVVGRKRPVEQKIAGLIAALVVATDGLLIVQSRIGMNDSLVVMLMLVVAWLFLKSERTQFSRSGWPWKLGLVVGLALGTKWSAIFLWSLIVGWKLIVEVANYFSAAPTKKYQLLTLPYRWFSYLVLPFIVYLLLFLPAALTHGAGYGYVAELHQQIGLYQTHRDANHAYASQPWEWMLNARPVWYWRDEVLALNAQPSVLTNVNSAQTANIYAVSHPFLPVVGLLAVAMIGGQLFWLVQKNGLIAAISECRSLVWLWLAYWVVWLPWLYAPRIMFYYHYAPAIPLLAGLIGVWLAPMVRVKQWIGWLLVLVWLVIAVLWLPQWWGLRVSQTMADRIYFALSSWH